ncbi:hypothetical protein ACFOYW_14450 [Gryllotalpicola reticulitermitis]|uniref:AbiEi antitoxin C-terminal domain-containing protein n=1 Tax=Gryllotalpicola reticulitermitis TaxID=1184153 RepID=A0ABV8Q871_9MICO
MRFSAVLTRLDLPVAELSALRLDGEAFALDEAVIAVDEPELAENRALALAGVLDERMTAELDTALWVYGCLDGPPRVHTASIGKIARGRLLSTTRVSLRETTVPDDELVQLGGIRVTGRARTLVDVALLESVSTTRVVAAQLLCRSPDVVPAALTIAVHLGRTPGKLRALERIREWAASAALSATRR